LSSTTTVHRYSRLYRAQPGMAEWLSNRVGARLGSVLPYRWLMHYYEMESVCEVTRHRHSNKAWENLFSKRKAILAILSGIRTLGHSELPMVIKQAQHNTTRKSQRTPIMIHLFLCYGRVVLLCMCIAVSRGKQCSNTQHVKHTLTSQS
jgi:hypothetical protein